MTPKAKLVSEGGITDHRRDIHDFFGLSYANYLVVNRSLLQSMPEEWQKDFVEMLEQFGEEFNWAMALQPSINVQILKREPELKPDREICPNCNGSRKDPEDPEDICEECDGDGEIEVEGNEYESAEEVGTMTDPVAHYERGRASVPPASAPISEILNSQHYRMAGEWLKANHLDAWREIHGPEYDPGDHVEIIHHPGHELPPVLKNLNLGFYDGDVVNVVEGSNNSLYLVSAQTDPFGEGEKTQVQVHADQLRKS